MVGVSSRRLASSGSPLEPAIGFSRAVRMDNVAAVSGTAPIGADGETVAVGDVGGQTLACIEIALKALADVGLGRNDVIRTRIMLTDISKWREAADVYGRFFGDIRPACTFVEVSGFIDKDWLVEIEMDAVAPA